MLHFHHAPSTTTRSKTQGRRLNLFAAHDPDISDNNISHGRRNVSLLQAQAQCVWSCSRSTTGQHHLKSKSWPSRSSIHKYQLIRLQNGCQMC
ncbi:hypothetical protein ZWY2020_023596 [Hordeum vulgare]|nr:hypothetical protein ZWY2020_023596 [Hordeum vulgare]